MKVSHEDASNEYPQHMFCGEIKKLKQLDTNLSSWLYYETVDRFNNCVDYPEVQVRVGQQIQRQTFFSIEK